jgi:hypothetical protein
MVTSACFSETRVSVFSLTQPIKDREITIEITNDFNFLLLIVKVINVFLKEAY